MCKMTWIYITIWNKTYLEKISNYTGGGDFFFFLRELEAGATLVYLLQDPLACLLHLGNHGPV